jgi:hypothetical protein
VPDLPDPIPVDELPDELPELPDGYRWELQITAETEIIHPDGTVTN